MLPRHLRRAIPTQPAFRLTASPYHPHAPLAALRYRTAAGSVAHFHSTSRRNDELPKSPFQTFVDVLRDELRKNRELQENVKQLQGDVDKFQDSEAMRKARAAYEHARVRVLSCSFSSTSLCSSGPLTEDGCLLYSSPRASKKTRGYGLRPRNSKNAVSKSETQSLKHSRQWKRATSPARYLSGLVVSFLMTYRCVISFLPFCRYPGLLQRSLRRSPLRPNPFVTLQHTRPLRRRSSTHSMIPARRSMPGSKRRRHGGHGGRCDLPKQAKRGASRRASLLIPSTSFFRSSLDRAPRPSLLITGSLQSGRGPRLACLLSTSRALAADKRDKSPPAQGLRAARGVPGVGEPGRVISPLGHVHRRVVVRRERDCARLANHEDPRSELLDGDIRARVARVHRARGRGCLPERGQ